MVPVISQAYSHFFSFASVHASPSFVLARRTANVGELSEELLQTFVDGLWGHHGKGGMRRRYVMVDFGSRRFDDGVAEE